MTETLWAPWRMEYILSTKTEECVFCTALAQGPQCYEENLILHVAPKAFVIMNRFPYTHAHIMVIPKRHVSKLDQLNKDEQRAFFDLTTQAQIALDRGLNPQGMNMGLNMGTAAGAGIKDHIHIHLVPRWNGDTNFMPLLADARVMPQHLTETYQTLRAVFENMDVVDE